MPQHRDGRGVGEPHAANSICQTCHAGDSASATSTHRGKIQPCPKVKEAEQSCACGTISSGTGSTLQCLQCTMSLGTQPHHVSPGRTKPTCTSCTEMSVGSGAVCSAWRRSAPAPRPIIFLTSRRGWCWLEMERGTCWLFSSQEVCFSAHSHLELSHTWLTILHSFPCQNLLPGSGAVCCFCRGSCCYRICSAALGACSAVLQDVALLLCC